MSEPTATKPVPVRLSYRYPNGYTLNYSGRAIAGDARSLTVLININEEFEPGLTLSVMAPFLGGLTTARIQEITRSSAYPGFFEMVLLLGNVARARSVSDVGGGSGRASGDADAAPGVESSQPAKVHKVPARPPLPVPDLVVEAAEKLAYELRKVPPRKILRVIEEIPPDLRPMSLKVAVAAALHVLQEKKHLEARQLLGSLADGSKEAER